MRHSIEWPVHRASALIDLQTAALGDLDLLLDDVETARHFGDRMFDLQARIHLDKIEPAVLEEKLESPDAAIADLTAGLHAGQPDGIDDPRRDTGAGASSTTFWWRRCIEQSRWPSQRAFPLLSQRTWISM